MPLDRTEKSPMYLIGRLAALAETVDDPLPHPLMDQALRNPLAALPILRKRIDSFGHAHLAEEIYALIDFGTLPAGPVKIEAQGPYWMGFYHQRGYPRTMAIERDALERAGRALAGDQWQSDLARRLGWDAARVREILRGARKMPGGAMADVIAALRLRSDEAAVVADELERLLAEGGRDSGAAEG